MFSKGKLFNICLILFVTVLSGCANHSPYNPNTKHDLEKVQTIAIVPADIYVGLNKFAGDDERLTEKEEENSPAIYQHSQDIVNAKGYKLSEFDFAQAMSDDDFAFLVSKFKEDVAEASKDPKVWSPVGDSARDLAAQVGADALLYVNYQGFRKSSGAVAADVGTAILVGVLTLGAAVPVSPQNAAITQTYLVDGISSDILWKNGFQGAESPVIVKQALKKFPTAVVIEENLDPADSEVVQPEPIQEL